ncbi:MAG TPA: hypothetical protein VGX71_25480 [Pseudaminobacter sp.]|nr:hypothetical protein [Pseudaminobacter sp.]
MHRQVSKHLLRPRAIVRPIVCAACGTRFLASRSTAVYCSNLCRLRAFKAKHNPKPEDRSASIIRVLRKLDLFGQVAPSYHNDPTPPTFALMIPRSIAACEINVFWSVSPVTADEVGEALKSQGFLDFKQAVPASANAKVRPRIPRSEIRNANSPKNSMKSVSAKRQSGAFPPVEPFSEKARQ